MLIHVPVHIDHSKDTSAIADLASMWNILPTDLDDPDLEYIQKNWLNTMNHHATSEHLQPMIWHADA